MVGSQSIVTRPPSRVRPIRVVIEQDEPLHYNTIKAAEKLGMSRQYLTEKAAEKVDGKPSIFSPCGKFGNDSIYHAYQNKNSISRDARKIDHRGSIAVLASD